jgi:integrase
MPRAKLTAISIERFKAPANGRIEYFDQVLPGFALRITHKGAKSWVVFYRHGGRLRRMTLGSYPALGLADARDHARQALQQAAKGNDPAAERAQRRSSTSQHVAGAVQLFIAKHASKNRTARETERIFNTYVLPKWRRRPLESITRRDVIHLLEDVEEHGPYMANRTLAAIRKFYSWAVERDMVGASPVSNVSALGREEKRDRVLDDVEIMAFWEGCDKLGWPFGPLFQMLLVTAQRRDEVARMRWQDVDLDAGTWIIPAEMTKSRREHSVPLSPLSLDILSNVPRMGGHVFSSNLRGDKPVSGFSKSKKRLDGLSGLDGWRLHDLRRTAASGMARLNVAPHVLGKVLNHAPASLQGVTAIYNRYAYEPQKREALEAWAEHIKAVLEQRPLAATGVINDKFDNQSV